MRYLRHLWEEADGEGQSESEGSQTHQAVDGQDEPPPPLQQREPGEEDNVRTLPFLSNLHLDKAPLPDVQRRTFRK